MCYQNFWIPEFIQETPIKYNLFFQLVVHIVDADDAPPVVRGLAVIDDGGFVTMGEGGNEIESKTISRIY